MRRSMDICPWRSGRSSRGPPTGPPGPTLRRSRQGTAHPQPDREVSRGDVIRGVPAAGVVQVDVDGTGPEGTGGGVRGAVRRDGVLAVEGDGGGVEGVVGATAG